MKVIVAVILAMTYFYVSAQVFQTESEKYWYYRDRMKYFVCPGTEPGQSILFSRRNASRENWDATDYSMNMEQPHMMMGFYVGMLATEYKLLKDNGQSASANETLIELNLALDALIRMDKCEDDIPWNSGIKPEHINQALL